MQPIKASKKALNSASQCRNERGCKRDEKYLFLYCKKKEYTNDSLREALKQVIYDACVVSVSFDVVKLDFGHPVRKYTSAELDKSRWDQANTRNL